MAKIEFPNALDLRDLLSGSRRFDDPVGLGDRLFEAGRHYDALRCYHYAEDEASVDRIASYATETGDAFLMSQLESLAGRTVAADDWRAVASKAKELGKNAYAAKALERAGDKAAAGELRAEHDLVLKWVTDPLVAGEAQEEPGESDAVEEPEEA